MPGVRKNEMIEFKINIDVVKISNKLIDYLE